MDSTEDNILGKPNIIKPNSARVFPIIISFIIIAIIIFIILSVKFTIESHFSTIDLLYAPTSATATIDGKTYSSGKIQVSPGTHEIVIQKYGFTTKTISIETYSGQTTPVNCALEPSESFTANWYENNYNDALIVQGVSSRNFSEQLANALEQYPALKKLPVKHERFSIYQATCNGTQICVMIDANDTYRNEAIEYFRTAIDSDLGRYYISFKNYSNPFVGEG